MEGALHVEADVIAAVGRLHPDVFDETTFRARAHGEPGLFDEVAKSHARPPDDRAPALAASQFGRHLDPREGPDLINRKFARGPFAGRADHAEPPRVGVDAAEQTEV